MDANEAIRFQIQNHMKARGVTQVDIARELGITPQSVSQVLRGDRSAVRKPLLDILDVLDLELHVRPKKLARGLDD